jgi:lysophospholipase L1-like esterase
LCRSITLSLLLVTLASSGFAGADGSATVWVGTWATSPFPEPAAKEQLPLAGATLRQIVHVSLGGNRLRLRLSNAFGTTPLALDGAHLALAGPAGAIEPATDRPLRFNGQTSVSIPPGAVMLSDPLDFELPPLADVAVSLHLQKVPATLTAHPGSRTTSYLQAGDAVAAAALPEARKVVCWYFINGLDVLAAPPAAAVVALGDSITDGRGSTTDHNDRWTDALARRLQAGLGTARVGVLNQGIGGNRLLRDGLGPNMLARFDRDVLVQTRARWVIVQAGINDIGTRIGARKQGEPFASPADIIAAYEQLIDRAHTQGLQIVGTTITPYAGADFYWTADGEADRQTVNAWIRTSGHFDAVVDFDAALRDPHDPSRLAAAFDSGDHLHPSPAGFVEMARVVDLGLFDLSSTVPTTVGEARQR